MSFFDKIFPRKGNDKYEKDEVEKAQEKNKADKGEKDEYSLEGFDFKHPMKSLREHLKFVKEGIYKGDKKAWHQFLMIMFVSFAGFCAIMTILINFCFDLVGLRYQLSSEHTAKVIAESKQSILASDKLSAGEYGILYIFQSASFGNGFQEPQKNLGNALMCAPRKGGAVMIVPIPEGTEVPAEWFGPDSYNLVVDADGKWTFEQSQDFENRREAVEKARQEYMDRMKEAKPQGEVRNTLLPEK